MNSEKGRSRVRLISWSACSVSWKEGNRIPGNSTRDCLRLPAFSRWLLIQVTSFILSFILSSIMLSITVARSACLKRLECSITLPGSVLRPIEGVASPSVLIRFLSGGVGTESHTEKKMMWPVEETRQSNALIYNCLLLFHHSSRCAALFLRSAEGCSNSATIWRPFLLSNANRSRWTLW